MLSIEDAATGEGRLVVLFMALFLSDSLFPQELETFINEMLILLAVIAELSLIKAITMSVSMIPFLKSRSLFFNLSMPTIPSGEVGNLITISNRFFRHLDPTLLNIKCLDFSIQLCQV
jgi:hypothetical protein